MTIYDENDLKSLTVFAAQAAVSIENTMLNDDREAYERVVSAVELWLAEGIATAMNRYNPGDTQDERRR